MKMRYIFTLALIMLCFANGLADDYQIREIMGPNILFKGRRLKEGDVIHDSDRIMLHPSNVLSLYNLSKGYKSSTISGINYRKRQCKSFSEYFCSKVGAVTRSEKGVQSLINQLDSIFFWVDSVTVITKYPKNYNRVFALEILDGSEDGRTIELPTFDGGKSFMIPQSLIYGKNAPFSFMFNLLVGIKDPESDEMKYDIIVSNSKLVPLKNL